MLVHKSVTNDILVQKVCHKRYLSSQDLPQRVSQFTNLTPRLSKSLNLPQIVSYFVNLTQRVSKSINLIQNEVLHLPQNLQLNLWPFSYIYKHGLFTFVSGLLHKSIDLAFFSSSVEHQVSHHNHSCGRLLIGTYKKIVGQMLRFKAKLNS